VKTSEYKALRKARRKEIAGKLSSMPMCLSALLLLHQTPNVSDIYSKINEYPELLSKTQMRKKTKNSPNEIRENDVDSETSNFSNESMLSLEAKESFDSDVDELGSSSYK